MQRDQRVTMSELFEGMLAAANKRPARPKAPRQTAPDEGVQHGLYIISVASRMLEMHPQTLRKYERVGLVSPSRTVGMLRLYSEQDIIKLRIIKHLVDEMRLNLAGVEMAMAVFDHLSFARERMVAAATTTHLFDQVFEQIVSLFYGRPVR
jgi:DNA-binding transcriptional MerR regulator